MKVLEHGGYLVSSAVDGLDVIEQFTKQVGEVALLLTDLAMPRKNGMELIRDVQSVHSALPIVVMSGNLLQAEDGLPGIPCIAKPFSPKTLLEIVEKRLASANRDTPAAQSAVCNTAGEFH